jgi:endonuclease YncB( thermonuclease family)
VRRGCPKIQWRFPRLAVAVLAAAVPVRSWAQSGADAAKVSAWATGGASANAKPSDVDGKPGPPPPAGVPYWQAPPLRQAVIQGGAIPPGWQPQPIPYQGIGPDGRPMTQYFAPTYVFTYQSGPPMLALPTGGQQPALMPATAGATMPAATVARYAPQPYQFPPGSRPLSGTPIVPPAGQPPAAAAPQSWGGAVPQAVPQPAAVTPPPPQWVPSTEAAVPGIGAAAAVGGAAGVAASSSPSAAAPLPQAAVGGPSQVATPPAMAPPPERAANSHLWRVVGVIDGDTVTCIDDANQSQKVRLADIDAPEITQPYGKNAREALAGMVFGHTVEVVDSGRDQSGCWIGRLFVDGTDVNRQMIATGNAWQDNVGSTDAELSALQSQAQAQRLGLWSQPNPTPPWQYQSAAPQ